MGYFLPIGSVYAINTPVQGGKHTVAAAAATIALTDCDLTIPDFSGGVKSAYIDLLIRKAANVGFGANYLDGDQYLQFSTDTGTTWTNCTLIKSGSLNSEIASIYLNVEILGMIDLSTVLVPGTVINFRWLLAKSTDDYDMLDISTRLRYMLGG